MTELKTLEDIWFIYKLETFNNTEKRLGDKFIKSILRQEAVKEFKIIKRDLSYKAPEILTDFEKMLMKAEKYIKWKFNITEKDLEGNKNG